MSFVLIVTTEEHRKYDYEIMKYRKKPKDKFVVSVYKNPSGIIIGEKSE